MGLFRILENLFDTANTIRGQVINEMDNRGLPVKPEVRRQYETYQNSNLKKTLAHNARKEVREETRAYLEKR